MVKFPKKEEERVYVGVKKDSAVGVSVGLSVRDGGDRYGCGCKVVDVGAKLMVCPEHRQP